MSTTPKYVVYCDKGVKKQEDINIYEAVIREIRLFLKKRKKKSLKRSNRLADWFISAALNLMMSSS